MKTKLILAGLGFGALTPPALAADVVAFLGAPGTPGDLFLLATDASHAPSAVAELSQIVILPVDYAARTPSDLFRTDRPRLFDGDPAALRVRLPLAAGGLGAVYHFARPAGALASATPSFGYFLVDPSAQTRILIELDGAGVLGDADPFVDRFAVSPDGSRLLFATTVSAGGDLLELDVAAGTVVNRTQGHAPLTFSGNGLGLGSALGFAASSSGFLRFAVAQSGDAAFVPFDSTPPAIFSLELATSANGLWAVGVAGDSATSEHVWVFGDQGSARQVTTAAADVSAAGYLPQYVGGPYLAVSDDGALAAWRTQEIVSVTQTTGEAWLGEVPPMPAQALQVSQDLYFTDTLDEVGQYLIAGSKLIFAVGETLDPATGAFDKLDLFQVELPAQAGGQPVLTNLSMSSGQAQAPFTQPPTLEPSATYWLPTAQVWLMQSDVAGLPSLVTVPTDGSAPTVYLDDVKELDMVEVTPGRIVLGLRRDSGSKPRQILLAPPDLLTTPVLAGTLPSTVGSPERSIADSTGFAAFVTPDEILGEFVWRVDTAAGTLITMTSRHLLYGALAFVSSGGLNVTVGAPNGPATFAFWPLGSFPYRLLSPGIAGTYLPGT